MPCTIRGHLRRLGDDYLVLSTKYASRVQAMSATDSETEAPHHNPLLLQQKKNTLQGRQQVFKSGCLIPKKKKKTYYTMWWDLVSGYILFAKVTSKSSFKLVSRFGWKTWLILYHSNAILDLLWILSESQIPNPRWDSPTQTHRHIHTHIVLSGVFWFNAFQSGAAGEYLNQFSSRGHGLKTL